MPSSAINPAKTIAFLGLGTMGAPMTLNDDFINTPKFTYNFAGEYGHRLSDRFDLTGRIDYIHKSRIQYDYGNSPLVDQAPFGLLNARLALDLKDIGLTFSVFGTNLTNTVYALGGHDDGEGGSLGFVLKQIAPPREWGASVVYHF